VNPCDYEKGSTAIKKIILTKAAKKKEHSGDSIVDG